MSITGPVSDEEWQAQHDARTLAQAEEIKASRTRMSAAKKQAKKIIKEKKQKIGLLEKVAKPKTKKSKVEENTVF